MIAEREENLPNFDFDEVSPCSCVVNDHGKYEN
jgi:hypothetical protein